MQGVHNFEVFAKLSQKLPFFFIYLYVQLFQKEGSDGVWKSVTIGSELYDGIKDQGEGSGG